MAGQSSWNFPGFATPLGVPLSIMSPGESVICFERKVYLFSATMTDYVKDISSKFMDDAETINSSEERKQKMHQ